MAPEKLNFAFWLKEPIHLLSNQKKNRIDNQEMRVRQTYIRAGQDLAKSTRNTGV